MPVVVVRAAPVLLEHLAEHAVRRLRGSNLADRDAVLSSAASPHSGASPRVIVVSSACVDEPWREVVRYLEVAPQGFNARSPRDVARRLVEAICDAIVIVDAELSSFGRSVIGHIAEMETELRDDGPTATIRARSPRVLVFTTSMENTALGAHHLTIEVDSHLEPDEIRAWWETAARSFNRLPSTDRLDSLAGWWRAASTTPADATVTTITPSPAGQRLLARLVLAGRAWPLSALAHLGARESHMHELRELGLVTVEHGLVAIQVDLGWSLDLDDLQFVADALMSVFDGDPWATMRAAELLARRSAAPAEGPRAERGLPDRVASMATRAIASVLDPDARDDLWRRYCALFTEHIGQKQPGDVAICLRTADLALRIGDVARAVEFSQLAASIEPDSFDVLLTRGCAAAATGDIKTAAIVIGKAMRRCAEGSAAWARAAVELAEVRYTSGELLEARSLAERALEIGRPASVRFAARNVLGKILLARMAFTEAELHFAEDACEAECAGESLAELRARLNRGIALMSERRDDEARGMLERVVELGEQRGEIKAVCFALGNLATIAILCRRYVDALALLGRTIDLAQRIGDKPRLALFITNLAELRLGLGLDREAEQLLHFGRRVCGVTSPRFAQFSLVSARILLARGRTVDAFRELGTALAASGASLTTSTKADDGLEHRWAGPVGRLVSECLRVAARVALEEGDTRRASDLLDRAISELETPLARAEVFTLRAACSRAAGEPFSALADDALEAAREADNEEILREALILRYHAAVMEGDRRRADVHLDRAISLRDQVAMSLPERIRERYLGRKELAGLRQLEEQRAAARATPTRIAEPEPTAAGGAPPQSADAPVFARGARAGGHIGDRTIVGSDPGVRALLAAIRKVGRFDTTVLIRGESGTGKELVAQALHEASPRRSGPFVTVNCAALVDTLILSELFGHEKGAFTGAGSRHLGRFEAAEGGTLLLDEIGDISARTQVALLRVLQEKTFERVGGTASIRTNVRVVCATHRDLKSLAQRGAFREDLYYRLSPVVLEVPALRRRLGDLGAVAEALLQRIADESGGAPKTLTKEALSALSRHTWPGNIRELENALRTASLFAEGAQVELEDFTGNVESLRGLDASRRGDDHGIGSGVTMRSEEIAREAAPDSWNGPRRAPPSSAGPVSSVSVSSPAPCTPSEIAYAAIRAGTSLNDLKEQIQRDCIARALADAAGNITRAAAILGMKRPRLSQLVKEYGLGGDGE